MGRNPVPILIPCHRVIGANRSIGGYGGYTYEDRQAALAVKRTLLAIEGSTTRD
jgi:methylated-DNA-[protein]-cysteine S-methyltransferase